MKKIFSITALTVSAAMLLFSACKKKVDEVYANPNANVRVPIETLLPGIIGNMVGSSSAQGSSYGTANDGLYVGRYVQFWATSTTNNQYDRMGGAIGASDVLGSIWAMHYYGMGQNLNRMIEWGMEEKKWDYVGVGYAIRAWSWLTLTDMYGEVILREAFNTSQLVFNYDEQKTVYDTVRVICRLALEYLSKTGDGVSQANLALGDAYFNNGDVEKWKKFTYSVMARSFNHLTNKASYNPDSVLYYSNLAINDIADNATCKFANTGISGTSNFFGPLRANVGALRQTYYIANLMSGLNTTFPGVEDPRAWYILRENNLGTFKGIIPVRGSFGLTTDELPRNFWGGSFTSTASSTDANARYLFKNGAPFPIVTASEIQFMKAEAYYRKGEKANALAAYREGIKLSFDMLEAEYTSAAIPVGKELTASVRDAFLANPVIVPDANDLTLSHIMQQKYIAMYGFGLVETWVDIRRYHYTDVEEGAATQVYAGFEPPAGTFLYPNNSGKWVYRARPRYNSEYLYNISELERIGAIALDYHTNEQWFSMP